MHLCRKLPCPYTIVKMEQTIFFDRSKYLVELYVKSGVMVKKEGSDGFPFATLDYYQCHTSNTKTFKA